MKWFVFVLGLFIIPLVSGLLAYEIKLEESSSGLRILSVDTVVVPSHEIIRPIIGKYLLVLDDGTNSFEKLDGVFFTLPERVFISKIDDNGVLVEDVEESNTSIIHIPYTDIAKDIKVFTSDGSEVAEYSLTEQLSEEQLETFQEEQERKQEEQEEQVDLSQDTPDVVIDEPFYKKNWKLVLIGAIALVLVILLFSLKKKEPEFVDYGY